MLVSRRPTLKKGLGKETQYKIINFYVGMLIVWVGRRETSRVRKTRLMDIKLLQVNDSSYIEGTICLVNE